MDSSWQLKFRRALLVFEGEVPQEMLQTLQEFANDVTLLDLQNPYGMDYLQLPADCMVVNSHIKDFLAGGYVMTTANSRGLPTLILHDDRPGWDVGCITGPKWVAFNPAEWVEDVRAFLDEVQPVDYERIMQRQPWLMRPWTVTMAQIGEARVHGSSFPY